MSGIYSHGESFSQMQNGRVKQARAVLEFSFKVFYFSLSQGLYHVILQLERQSLSLLGLYRMLRFCALMAASGREEARREEGGRAARRSPRGVLGREEGSELPKHCLFVFPVFGNSWSSQTYLKSSLLSCYQTHTCKNTTSAVVPFVLHGHFGGDADSADGAAREAQTGLKIHCSQRTVLVGYPAGKSHAGFTDI